MKIKNLKLKIKSRYFPQEIEAKWQEKWKKDGLYKFKDDQKPHSAKALRDKKVSRGKYYNLVELPYPSGDLHLGHWFAFVPPDAHARYKRMSGYDVFFPNGFDAFGLPAENAAIKRGIHPKDWTMKNIKTMTKQFETMGTMIDWDYTAITCLPEYYRWNQWIFLKMLEKGLAYRGKALSNWCPSCNTVVANENIEAGKCWRCGSEVIQKEVEQWFLKITDYAERLIWLETGSNSRQPHLSDDARRALPQSELPPFSQNHKSYVDWPKQVREGQNNWIGKSEGMLLKFEIQGSVVSQQSRFSDDTRQDLSQSAKLPRSLSESRLSNSKNNQSGQEPSFDSPQSELPPASIENGKFSMVNSQSYIEVFTTRPETTDGATFLVIAPEHPFVQMLLDENLKPKTSNLKLKDIREYVEEAKKKTEMERKEDRTKSGKFSGKYVKNPVTGKDIPVWISDYVLAGYGTGAIMAVPFADQRDKEFAQKFNLPIEETSFKAKPDGQKKVNYHLHDWSISRQRYWGTPIPVIHCRKDGLVPVPLQDLPVELPYNVDYTPKGKPPLATDEEWLNVKCSKCGGKAKRDAETLDTFFDSAWYYYRYTSPNFTKGPFDREKVKELLPVDVYFGGSEHTLGHTLYARFFTKFFKDLGLVDFDEFALKRVQHGVVLGPDGNRMSKSRGNVVNPDDIVKEYGSDAVRLYLCFMMPYEATSPWSVGAINGIYRFLKRVWELAQVVSELELTTSDLTQMHKTIKKVGDDLNNFQFNTAVAALMTWLNFLSARKRVAKEEYETFLKLLAPFAPHITEEIWQSISSSDNSIHLENWPLYQANHLIEENTQIAVAVNGKARAAILVPSSKINEQNEVEKLAKDNQSVGKYINDRQIKKVIYVKGRIINFVVSN